MPSSDIVKVGMALTFGGALGALTTCILLKNKSTHNDQEEQALAMRLRGKLPKVFVYDHCPFCVRVRMIFGLKKIPYDLVFLANADEDTPIGLVGAKQVPIMVTPEAEAMAESMDIVRYVDQHYGGKVLLFEASGRPELAQWIKSTADIWRMLYHPRFHAASVLPEFAQQDSRDYYQTKKEKTIGKFDEALKQTPQLLEKANKALEDLAKLFASETSVNPGGNVSYDDIDFFARLRGLTLVKDLKWPAKLRKYVDHMAKITDIPLYDDLATM